MMLAFGSNAPLVPQTCDNPTENPNFQNNPRTGPPRFNGMVGLRVLTFFFFLQSIKSYLSSFNCLFFG